MGTHGRFGRSVSEIGEQGLLDYLKSKVTCRHFPHVHIGIGDDAAVLHLNGQTIVSTDMLIENIDFSLDWATAEDIGHKAAAVNLSDLAAMGVQPRALFCSIAMQKTYSVRQIQRILKKLHLVGQAYQAPLIGGDISETQGPLVLSVTAVGESSTKKVLRRYQADIGDIICVSGQLGGASAALKALQAGKKIPRAILLRQLRPLPQVKLGLLLSRLIKTTSCTDISDGLIQDSLHLPSQGLGVSLNTNLLPHHPSLPRLAKYFNVSHVDWMLHGGEDFELLFTLKPRDMANAQSIFDKYGIFISRVGTVVKKTGIWVDGKRWKYKMGFQHFSKA